MSGPERDTIRNPLRVSVMSLQACPVSGIKPAGVMPCEWRNAMSDPMKRAERWKAKYNVERVKDTLNDIREDMGKRYEAAIAEVCIMEAKVKEVINAAGISTVLYVSYLNFGRQLYKLTRKQNITGESFAMAAQVLLDKWSARGCDPKVLATIRKEVFNIDAPKK
jgi:hypothetical protein